MDPKEFEILFQEVCEKVFNNECTTKYMYEKYMREKYIHEKYMRENTSMQNTNMQNRTKFGCKRENYNYTHQCNNFSYKAVLELRTKWS